MSKIHLINLVDRYQAKSASWEYVENPKHVTKGVMHWVVTLYNATAPKWEYPSFFNKTHVIELANGSELIVDEYVTRLVLERFTGATT